MIDVARLEGSDSAKTKPRKKLSARYGALANPAAGEGEIQIVDLGDADQIDSGVNAARRVLQRPNNRDGRRGLALDDDDAEAEKKQRDAPGRTGPIDSPSNLEKIGGARQLIVSPDAALWLIPWGALPLVDGRYAVEAYQFQYVVSGRDLMAEPATTADTTAAGSHGKTPTMT